MNARQFIEFFKSKTGALILFAIGFGLVVLLLILKQGKEGKIKNNINNLTQTAPTVITELKEFKQNVPDIVTGTTAPREIPKQTQPPPDNIPIVIDLYTTKEKNLGPETAPFGRLIKCILVNTLESSNLRTPIIGLVTEPIYNNGSLIIPAGCEVHGQSELDRVRDRIADRGQWVIVWTDGSGREMPVSGVALNHAPIPSGGWEITDGSAGLKGYTIKSDNYQEIKLFAATFLSGLGEGFRDTTSQVTTTGTVTQTTGNLRTALGTATQRALDAYAQDILREIQRNGIYVRVPASTQFYLYVTQTLDPAQATRGSTRTNLQTSNPIKQR